MNELEVFQSLPIPTGHISVHKWWFEHKSQFPVLFRLYCRYLAIPITTVRSEWIWSDAGNIVTKKRAALTPEHVSQLVVCYENRDLLFN
jgi:hypothetical protein